MDYIALICVNCILKRGKTWKRIAGGSVLASGISLLLHIGIEDAMLRMIVLHFGLNMGMAWVVFGFNSKKELLENWLIIYLAVLFLGGIMEWETNMGFPVSFFWGKALVAALLLTVSSQYLMQRKKILERIYKIEIIQNGRSYFLRGYWDSGNLLTDPYMGAPVNIVGKETADRIFEMSKVRIRMIPYCSLGCKDGLLPIFNVQKMYIYEGTEKREIMPAILGVAGKELLKGKEYDVILQSSVLKG